MNDRYEALDDLERICTDYFLGCKECTVKKIYAKEYNTIKETLLKAQKEHKALEVIKEKCRRNYNLALVDDSQNYKVYCEQFDYFISNWLKDAGAFEVREEDKLTEEEFNTVKGGL